MSDPALDDFIEKVFFDTAVYNPTSRICSSIRARSTSRPSPAKASRSTGFHQANALVAMYRTDLFENADEMAAFESEHGRALLPSRRPGTSSPKVAKFFTRPDENLYGTTLMAGNGDWATDDFKTLLAAWGGDGYMVSTTSRWPSTRQRVSKR